MKTKLTVLMAIALALSACSAAPTATLNAEALPRGVAIEALDGGKLDSLPTGRVYIRFIRFEQQPGYVINSKQHVPSIVFVETGVHRLILEGQPIRSRIPRLKVTISPTMHCHKWPTRWSSARSRWRN